MVLYRWLCPSGRMVRAARGLLLALSGIVVMVTVVVLHRMDNQITAHHPLVGASHSAQRALQQADNVSCTNCTASVDLWTNRPVAGDGGAADRPVGVTAESSPPPPPPQEAQQDNGQQQEHEQQQENLKVEPKTPDAAPPPEPVAPPAAAAAAAADDEPIAQAAAEPAKPGAKPDSAGGKLNVARLTSNLLVKSWAVAVPKVAAAAPAAYENPSVLTRSLYVAGHRLMANNNLCPEHGLRLRLLILVTTAPGHFKQREAVRGTWGHVALRNDVALAFMVGVSQVDTDNRLLAVENLIYGDIIQGNFVDSYNNLTLKTISMLEWAERHCSRVPFVLKTDDDMYIHMPQLFGILDKSQKERVRRSIMGKVARRWKPIRNTTSKYFISESQFGPAQYPDFNTGPAYVLTSDILGQLYRASLDDVFFKLEDVYVTGMMATKLRIQHIDYPQFYNRRLKLDTCAVHKLASVHMVKTFEMYDLWKRLNDGLTRCT